jgi:exosortase/archaeosortase family protein
MRMNAVKINGFKARLSSRTVNRLLLWLVLSLALSIIFFRDFWASLPGMLSPSWVLGQHHAAPWGVLALCIVFGWLKRRELREGMSLNSHQILRSLRSLGMTMGAKGSLGMIFVGLGLVAGAVLMPSSQDYLVFQVLLASLGVFVIIFGMGAKIPSILLAIYGFAISFPLAVERFAENAYSQTAITPLMGLMTTLGYPLQGEGQWVHFTSTGGEPISVAITIGCAGPATMGVFIALFALMMLDMPLPPKKAGGMFLFGVVGTWLQSFIRMVILMLAGYYLGEGALWTAHFWTIYILFPLWYLLFAYVYFRQLGRPPQVRGKQELKHMLVTER